jgi:hypothetical protein
MVRGLLSIPGPSRLILGTVFVRSSSRKVSGLTPTAVFALATPNHGCVVTHPLMDEEWRILTSSTCSNNDKNVYKRLRGLTNMYLD